MSFPPTYFHTWFTNISLQERSHTEMPSASELLFNSKTCFKKEKEKNLIDLYFMQITHPLRTFQAFVLKCCPEETNVPSFTSHFNDCDLSVGSHTWWDKKKQKQRQKKIQQGFFCRDVRRVLRRWTSRLWWSLRHAVLHIWNHSIHRLITLDTK